jgi:Histidine kinase-like ATPase domain
VTGEDRFLLDLRPEPAYVAPARIFASELARQAGVSEELLDDVKVAVGEALNRALGAPTPPDELRVKASRRDGRLFFEIPQGETVGTPGSTTDRLTAALSLELITVLFEDGEAVVDEHGEPVIRFSVPAA